MTFWRPTLLLSWRALRQYPRNPALLVFSLVPPVVQILLFGALFEALAKLPGFPTRSYYTYLLPAVVLFTTVIGIGNAGIALVTDIESRYFQKLLVTPASMLSILLGRLLSDGLRVMANAAVILVIGLSLGAKITTGVGGAILILVFATVFSILTVGALVANIALKTKSQQGTQAIFPIFFIGIFLTSAFNTKENLPSILRTIIQFNPAQYVVEALQDIAFRGFDAGRFAIAVAVTLGIGLVGGLLTWRNFRNVYA